MQIEYGTILFTELLSYNNSLTTWEPPLVKKNVKNYFQLADKKKDLRILYGLD